MDQIDINLFDAWNRIGSALKADPARALKRWRTRILKHSTRHFRPERSWCLCLRASDHRINTSSSIIHPPDALNLFLDHSLTITGSLIRQLAQPINIPWPGVTTDVAARILGLSRKMVCNWLRKGYLRLDRREYAGIHGTWGTPRAIVYTPSPIDINHPAGRTPLPMWGSAWQHLWQLIPEHFEQTITRVARFRPNNSIDKFRGWDFLCPGRLIPLPLSERATSPKRERGNSLLPTPTHCNAWDKAHGLAGGAVGPSANDLIYIDNRPYIHRRCNRLCKYLFAPMPVWTIAHTSEGARFTLDIPASSGLVGSWTPGLTHHNTTPVGTGHRWFACKSCWQVRTSSMTSPAGWNDFVTLVSGGMLYGREVPRPASEAPSTRKNRFAHHAKKPRPAHEAPRLRRV